MDILGKFGADNKVGESWVSLHVVCIFGTGLPRHRYVVEVLLSIDRIVYVVLATIVMWLLFRVLASPVVC